MVVDDGGKASVAKERFFLADRGAVTGAAADVSEGEDEAVSNGFLTAPKAGDAAGAVLAVAADGAEKEKLEKDDGAAVVDVAEAVEVDVADVVVGPNENGAAEKVGAAADDVAAVGKENPPNPIPGAVAPPFVAAGVNEKGLAVLVVVAGLVSPNPPKLNVLVVVAGGAATADGGFVAKEIG